MDAGDHPADIHSGPAGRRESSRSFGDDRGELDVMRSEL